MHSKTYYPVYLDLNGKACLVVGGGRVALRKVKTLLECNAGVRLIGSKIIPEIKKLKQKYKNFVYYEKPYESKDLKNVILVITATDNNKLNAKIAKDAFKKKQLNPEISDKLNLIYARDYSFSTDLNIIFRGYRELGRKHQWWRGVYL